MDKLKEYLARNKDGLDVDPPAGESWENIQAQLPDGRGAGRLGVFSGRGVRLAAAACVIALAGVGVWWVMRDNNAPVETAKQEAPVVKDTGSVEKTKPKGQEAPVAGSGSAKKRVRGVVRKRKPVGATDAIEAIDRSYSTLIDYQLKKLRATPLYAESGNYFSFYVDQFKQMDQDEKQVRDDIKAYGLTNEFLEQLINVYQQKLNLLKNLQTEINKVNNKVRENAAPSAKTEVYYLNI